MLGGAAKSWKMGEKRTLALQGAGAGWWGRASPAWMWGRGAGMLGAESGVCNRQGQDPALHFVMERGQFLNFHQIKINSFLYLNRNNPLPVSQIFLS